MQNIRNSIRYLGLALSLAFLTGCAAAAGAAAGAAGAIAYNERGAESEVNASVTEVARAAEEALVDMGYRITGRETEEGEMELEAERGDVDVEVDIDEDDGLTKIYVVARESMVDYEREEAHRILQRILAEI